MFANSQVVKQADTNLNGDGQSQQTETVQTGDQSQLILWMSLMAVAVVFVVRNVKSFKES